MTNSLLNSEIEKLKVLSEKLTNKKLNFHQYSSNWVYLGQDIVVKVSKMNLQYEIDFVNYLAKFGFPALRALSHHKLEDYYFYVYPRGETDISQKELINFLGENIARLNSIDIPKSPNLVTYEKESKENIRRWVRGFELIPKLAQKKIYEMLNRSYRFKVECISHGDPIYGNTVRMDGNLFLIDWEHVSKGPKELDLATIKHQELYGEHKDTFEKVAKQYGQYNTEKLHTLLDARIASSIVWYAKNVKDGYFKDNGELERRIARLMGDSSIIYVKAV